MSNIVLSSLVSNEEQMQIAKKEAEDFIKNQKLFFDGLRGDIDFNRAKIESTEEAINYCGTNTINSIKGKIFGTVTESVLKEALTQLTKDQLTGIYTPLLKILNITNSNIETISKINQGIMALQLIMAYQVMANTKVETERAARISQLSEKVKDGNITLDELIDLALETSELQEKRELEINNHLLELSNRIEDLNIRVDGQDANNNKLFNEIDSKFTGLHSELTTAIQGVRVEINNLREQIDSKIDESKKTMQSSINKLQNQEEAERKELKTTLQSENDSKLREIRNDIVLLNKKLNTNKRFATIISLVCVCLIASIVMLAFNII